MHVAIRRYRVDPGSVAEIMRQINEGFIPIIKETDGFLAYFALNAGAGEFATVSVFEDQAGAEESIRLAADFVRQNLPALLTNPPQITSGEVEAHELSLTRLGMRHLRE
jgi:quinol monooxygenase YgiN